MRAFAWTLGLSLLIAAGAAAQQAPDLSGASSDEIKALQQRLTADGCYQGAIDGRPNPAFQDAIKACPSQDPILRIETGMHVAPIRGIATDSACRIAVTVSDDKTARIWSLPDGKLIRTQRMPIGEATDGLLNAVAMSPDGTLIAAGGSDAYHAVNGTGGIYLFDEATGAAVRHLGVFRGAVTNLAFSPDGKALAVAHEDGISVFDLSSGMETLIDHQFTGPTSSVAFGPDGTLYADAWDGYVRRYEPTGYRRTAKVRAGSAEPMGLAVDPTGQTVAVAYRDSSRIDLFDARSLKRIGTAETNDIKNGGTLTFLTWLQDGSLLGAGSFRQDQGDQLMLVRTFDARGRRIGEDRPISSDAVLALTPCGAGVAFASADPSFGLVGAQGPPQVLARGRMVDMRPNSSDPVNTDAILVSPDGKRVYFGLNTGGNHAVMFDLAAGALQSPLSPPDDLLHPDTTGLPISDWQYNIGLRLGRSIIRMPDNTLIYSLAIRPDKTGFILGSSHYMISNTASGHERWVRGTNGTAWGLNFARAGNLIVGAYGDGTVRWHRWSDGKELLALFVDKDTKRWVAWTPSGYYMASPGGEDLIGWQVNRGWSQPADFFPASRFRDRFNRPDIVQLVLDTLDENAAIRQANSLARRREDTRPLIDHLPPIIRIAAPADDAHVRNGMVTLDYAVRSSSGQPVNRLDLLINGRPVKAFGLPIKPLAPNAEITGSIPVTLTQHVTKVGLIAWSEGLASQAAQVSVTWDAAPETTRKLYALVIGVSNYADPSMTLKYAAKDAGDFAKALADQKGLYYADVQTRVLTDRQVTRASVIEGLEWLEKSATNPNDVSVLFLAGHGMTDDTQTYWFYTSDSNDNNLRINGVSQDELRKSLQGLSGKVLWFLDTCHAGAAAKRSPVDVNVLVNTVSASENGGIVVFASSTGRQVSVETADLGNGAFTKAVIEGIALGKADLLGDGFVTTSSLDTYVAHRVEQFTDDQQTPVMERPPQEPDFAIAEVRK